MTSQVSQSPHSATVETPDGPVERLPLTRTQQYVGSALARAWTSIPHVTHFDEADISGAEAVCKDWAVRHGDKVSLLALIVKSVARVLTEFPRINASLDADGATLVLKKYVHVGVAVDTPKGLLVPVLRDCNHKNAAELTAEIGELAGKARSKGLSRQEMSGGCFTVSSLGSIGGTGFTPIINAPELAILGVGRTQDRLALRDGAIVSTKMLPLCLSYDHRVINGADAARFIVAIATALADPATLEAQP